MPWKNSKRKHRIWRLLSCTVGAHDTSDDENAADLSTQTSDTRVEKKELQQYRTQQLARFRRGKPNNRRMMNEKSEDPCHKNEVAIFFQKGTARDDRRRQSMRLRPQHRHHHHHRSQRVCVCSGGDASMPVCSAGTCHGRISKRLMVAMLEDGSTGDCHHGKMRVRTTRDEVSIRRIFHQLSATMDADYPSESPVEIPRSSALRSSHRGQSGNMASPRTSRTMTLPASPQAMQQPTARTEAPGPQSSPSTPPPPPPRTLQQPQASSSPVVSPPSPTPPPPPPPPPAPQTSQASGWVRVSVPSSSVQQPKEPQEQNQMQPNSTTSQQVSTTNKTLVQEERKAIRGSGRRGYRLFRRVFSVSDNYYAAPFPPMESIKLTSDEDQWEDLEILVTGHNGVKAIMPKTGDKKPEGQNPSASQNRRESSRIPVPMTSVQKQQQQQQQQQHPGYASESGDAKQPQAKPPMQQKQSSLKAIQHQQQLNQCNQQQSPPALNMNQSKLANRAGANPSQQNQQESGALQFGYPNRQQQHQQQQQLAQQQRRANPLMSPNRLLNRLGPPCNGEAGCARQRAILLPPPPPPPPMSPFGVSPKQRRSVGRDRPVHEFGLGRSSRYGKL